jgi:hypothetical protein
LQKEAPNNQDIGDAEAAKERFVGKIDQGQLIGCRSCNFDGRVSSETIPVHTDSSEWRKRNVVYQVGNIPFQGKWRDSTLIDAIKLKQKFGKDTEKGVV